MGYGDRAYHRGGGRDRPHSNRRDHRGGGNHHKGGNQNHQNNRNTDRGNNDRPRSRQNNDRHRNNNNTTRDDRQNNVGRDGRQTQNKENPVVPVNNVDRNDNGIINKDPTADNNNSTNSNSNTNNNVRPVDGGGQHPQCGENNNNDSNTGTNANDNTNPALLPRPSTNNLDRPGARPGSNRGGPRGGMNFGGNHRRFSTNNHTNNNRRFSNFPGGPRGGYNQNQRGRGPPGNNNNIPVRRREDHDRRRGAGDNHRRGGRDQQHQHRDDYSRAGYDNNPRGGRTSRRRGDYHPINNNRRNDHNPRRRDRSPGRGAGSYHHDRNQDHHGRREDQHNRGFFTTNTYNQNINRNRAGGNNDINRARNSNYFGNHARRNTTDGRGPNNHQRAPAQPQRKGKGKNGAGDRQQEQQVQGRREGNNGQMGVDGPAGTDAHSRVDRSPEQESGVDQHDPDGADSESFEASEDLLGADEIMSQDEEENQNLGSTNKKTTVGRGENIKKSPQQGRGNTANENNIGAAAPVSSPSERNRSFQLPNLSRQGNSSGTHRSSSAVGTTQNIAAASASSSAAAAVHDQLHGSKVAKQVGEALQMLKSGKSSPNVVAVVGGAKSSVEDKDTATGKMAEELASSALPVLRENDTGGAAPGAVGQVVEQQQQKQTTTPSNKSRRASDAAGGELFLSPRAAPPAPAAAAEEAERARSRDAANNQSPRGNNSSRRGSSHGRGPQGLLQHNNLDQDKNNDEDAQNNFQANININSLQISPNNRSADGSTRNLYRRNRGTINEDHDRSTPRREAQGQQLERFSASASGRGSRVDHRGSLSINEQQEDKNDDDAAPMEDEDAELDENIENIFDGEEAIAPNDRRARGNTSLSLSASPVAVRGEQEQGENALSFSPEQAGDGENISEDDPQEHDDDDPISDEEEDEFLINPRNDDDDEDEDEDLLHEQQEQPEQLLGREEVEHGREDAEAGPQHGAAGLLHGEAEDVEMRPVSLEWREQERERDAEDRDAAARFSVEHDRRRRSVPRSRASRARSLGARRVEHADDSRRRRSERRGGAGAAARGNADSRRGRRNYNREEREEDSRRSRSHHRRSRYSRSSRRSGRDDDDEEHEDHDRAASHSNSNDDIEHFQFANLNFLGTDSKWRIGAHLGDGTFGRVIEVSFEGTPEEREARGLKEEKSYAAKVIRSGEKYRTDAEDEFRILQRLQDESSRFLDGVCEGKHKIVHLVEQFMHPAGPNQESHFVMVFEKLSVSLYDHLTGNQYRPMYLRDIQKIGKDGFDALTFMHNLGCVHTDLKPENILFEYSPTRTADPPKRCWKEYEAQQVGGDEYTRWKRKYRYSFLGRRVSPSRRNREGVLVQGCFEDGEYRRPRYANIKIIDCGGAIFEDVDRKSEVISTRQYRSPEVMIGVQWDARTDVYSFGCILMELYLGDILNLTSSGGGSSGSGRSRDFRSSNPRDLQQLLQMETIGGGFSDDFLRVARDSTFRRAFRHRRNPARSSDGYKYYTYEVKPCQPLVLGRLDEFIYEGHDNGHARPFRTLCERCLTVDPLNRLSSQRALSEDFFHFYLPEDD
ncbi:unnamed protein product [Amoebophrya sp. A120]|nr:unnamed protein product [Amoebophrya sp. A120]|eukprot:GSA120T00020800001.1